MRKKFAVALVSLLATFGATIAVAPSASATGLGGISAASYCKWKYGWDDTAHGNNVMSWQCVARGSAGVTYVFGGVDMNKQCVRQYGAGAVAKYTNFNNPYSWYCTR